MHVLTVDAALDGCSAALVVDGAVVAVRDGVGGRGQAAVLPCLVQGVLAGVPAAFLDRIAVTVGPGSFTGLRAALALAHGIGLSAGVPVVGVTVGAALAAEHEVPEGWTFWAALRARAGHVFLQTGDAVCMAALDALPEPGGPALLAGNAAAVVAERWAPRPVRVSPLQSPGPAAIARAAAAHPHAPEPLYVEPPRTTGPAAPAA